MEYKKMLSLSKTKSVIKMFVHPDFNTGVTHILINLLRGYTKLSENITQIQPITVSEAS
jgi:hypothetical protein